MPQAVEVKPDLRFEFSKKKVMSSPLCLYMNIPVLVFSVFLSPVARVAKQHSREHPAMARGRPDPTDNMSAAGVCMT